MMATLATACSALATIIGMFLWRDLNKALTGLEEVKLEVVEIRTKLSIYHEDKQVFNSSFNFPALPTKPETPVKEPTFVKYAFILPEHNWSDLEDSTTL